MTKRTLHLLVIPIGLILYGACTSCSIGHKLITRTHETVDSTSSHRTDSSATHVFVDSSNYIYLDNSDITVQLDTTATKGVDTFSHKDIQVIHDVVKAVAGNQRVKSVTIHIGTFKDSTRIVHMDSSIHVIKSDTSTEKRAVSTVQKQVTRTSYIIFGIAAFILIFAFVIIKFKLL
jgi:hypothetical protein